MGVNVLFLPQFLSGAMVNFRPVLVSIVTCIFESPFFLAGNSFSCRLSSMLEKLFESFLWAHMLSKSEPLHQRDFCFKGQELLLMVSGRYKRITIFLWPISFWSLGTWEIFCISINYCHAVWPSLLLLDDVVVYCPDPHFQIDFTCKHQFSCPLRVNKSVL